MVVKELTHLTKGQPTKVVWCDQCEEAFKTLKSILCSKPVLRGPDFTKTFMLQTDASDRGIGAVLSLKDKSDEDHPITYFSKKLLLREKKYSVIEKECLAIKLACQSFQVYHLGRRFEIQTDHRALEWMDKLKENNARFGV